MKGYVKMLQAVSLVGQLGFTILTPPVAMTLLGWWLQDRFGWGSWVIIVCLVLGLLTAGASAAQLFRKVLSAAGRKAEKEEQKKPPVVYYTHE